MITLSHIAELRRFARDPRGLVFVICGRPFFKDEIDAARDDMALLAMAYWKLHRPDLHIAI